MRLALFNQHAMATDNEVRSGAREQRPSIAHRSHAALNCIRVEGWVARDSRGTGSRRGPAPDA